MDILGEFIFKIELDVSSLNPIILFNLLFDIVLFFYTSNNLFSLISLIYVINSLNTLLSDIIASIFDL